jgi:ABC-2 type transport system permease protein
MSWLRVAWSTARLELGLMARERLFVGLTMLAAVSFVVMVSLFGLTGSRAPMALIDRDQGRYARLFVEAMNEAHHSFRLIPMGQAQADALIGQGRLVGSITIPADFSRRIAAGQTTVVQVRIDNVDVDLTNDVQRAMPAAIVIFGHKAGFSGIRAEVEEHDWIPHDTDYVPYLAVSALALAGFVITASLSALAVAREWEVGTITLWRVSPASPTALLAGKLLATSLVALGALAAAVLAVVIGYGVHPKAPLTLAVVLVASVVIFSCMGAWLGAILRRTLPVVPLTFGLVLPLYMDSGALEPTRFDGDPIWIVAHLTPLYYAVGVLEWTFHGLQVTPEPIPVDLLVLVAFAVAAILVVRGALQGRGW